MRNIFNTLAVILFIIAIISAVIINLTTPSYSVNQITRAVGYCANQGLSYQLTSTFIFPGKKTITSINCIEPNSITPVPEHVLGKK
ncbi:MAG: hypothetical protein M0R77_00690 [Gammaproteobacteria bacterium]|nr:hypothetical protein [Acholeplasmataceae bacterium]MCK9529071.1 hypothetical protein [Gammaproteobacteria bacterium]